VWTATEVTLRAFPALCPPQQQIKVASSAAAQAFLYDPDLGARPAPLRNDTVRTPDYRYLATTDSLGFPNPPTWPRRPEIVVLGNSLVTGPGVGIEGQFSTLLARSLGGVGVLDLGLPGGSPAQQLRIYSTYVRPLGPSVVIATLWVASDVDNAAQFKHWLEEGSPPDFTAYRKSFGTTHGRMMPLKAVRDWLSGSYALRALYYGAGALARRGGPQGRVRFADGQTIFLSTRAQTRLAEGTTRPGLDVQEDFIAPLMQLRTDADADGARFVIVLLLSKEEVYGASAFPDVLTTVEAVRGRLHAADLPVLDLYPVFRDQGRSRPPFYKRDIHFNAYGNELVAHALEAWVKEGG